MTALAASETISAPRRLSLAALCKAASDPLRLDILRALSSDSFGVQELASIFAMPQPGMSHHLKILTKAGLLETRRQGNSIFYRRALTRLTSDFGPFVQQLFATVSELQLDQAHLDRIDSIFAERSEQSRLYFERNANRFAENQGMLVELEDYLPNLVEMLDLVNLTKSARVLEVGPGDARLLRVLSDRFASPVALDSSEEMLALAKSRMGDQASVEWVASPLETYRASRDFNLVVLNMVLHHLPSPQSAFHHLRSLMADDGWLLVADLGSHNQEWAHTACGDLWLGFDPSDLTAWAEAAGLAEVQSLYLGFKNGFQVQLKLFRNA